jgi:hypothetical protein
MLIVLTKTINIKIIFDTGSEIIFFMFITLEVINIQHLFINITYYFKKFEMINLLILIFIFSIFNLYRLLYLILMLTIFNIKVLYSSSF